MTRKVWGLLPRLRFHLSSLLSPWCKFFYDLKNSFFDESADDLIEGEQGRVTEALLLLQVLLVVNCGCVIVAIIAASLIIIDVTDQKANKEFFRVRVKLDARQLRQLTKTFVSNSWSCWNSAFWWSQSSSQGSSPFPSSNRSPQLGGAIEDLGGFSWV